MAETHRATVYLEPRLHKAVKMKAVETDQSLSQIINEALRQNLAEDARDLEAIETRRSRPERAFSDFLKELKKDGLL